MAEVNWILKLNTHGSPYLHSKPPTSLLDLPNHKAERAYEIDRACTVCMALCRSTAHSPQWVGTQGGGPNDRGPSVTFSLGPFAVKDLGVILSRFNTNRFFSCFVAPSLWICFILRETDTSVFPSFPRVAIFESSDGPAVSVPSWNKLTLSPPRLVPYLMRKTSADIPAFQMLL